MKQIFSLIIFALFSSNLTLASEYPYDYEVKSTCQTNGPVTVCRGLQFFTNQVALNVLYHGRLAKSPGLKVYVKVNTSVDFREGTFPMSLQSGSDGSGTGFARVTGGCVLSDHNGGCTQWGSDVMKNLLFWGQHYNKLNGLNFELAFVSDDKSAGWDNNGGCGVNYHFNFLEN